MSNNIESENLTITLPNDIRCNKNCPYCISKITIPVKSNRLNWIRNLAKAKYVAKNAGVGSVMITGKTEPTLLIDTKEFDELSRVFYEFPLEIQVNDVLVARAGAEEIIHKLFIFGINTVAISVDLLDMDFNRKIEKLAPFLSAAKDKGLVTRISFNITDSFDIPNDFMEMDEFFDTIRKTCVDQVMYRNIIAPVEIVNQSEEAKNAVRWIREHTSLGNYHKLEALTREYINDRKYKRIRRTKWGMDIYDIQGISFGVSERCIQEDSEYNKIRSLIYQGDGHMYTSWNSECKLF